MTAASAGFGFAFFLFSSKAFARRGESAPDVLRAVPHRIPVALMFSATSFRAKAREG
jgi:hypothetical protein